MTSREKEAMRRGVVRGLHLGNMIGGFVGAGAMFGQFGAWHAVPWFWVGLGVFGAWGERQTRGWKP